MKKRIVLEFVFDEVEDDVDPDWVRLDLVKIERTHSDLTDDQLSSLGEEVAQTDRWQVSIWNDISEVLGGDVKKVRYARN